MKDAIKTTPMFFDAEIYPKIGGQGRGQRYLILAVSLEQAQSWLAHEADQLNGSAGEVVYRGHTINTVKKSGTAHSPHMVNVCTFGYEPPENKALEFYDALIDGTETLGGVVEKHGPMAVVNLVYLLGGMMREDAGVPDSPYGACVELWDHHDDLGLLDLLNEIKAECPELAPAIQLGIDKIHVMPMEE